MLYHAYEMTHAAFSPMRAAARMGQEVMRNPLIPWRRPTARGPCRPPSRCSSTPPAATASRPSASPRSLVDGVATPVDEEFVWSAPFCNLLHFRREFGGGGAAQRSQGAGRRADVGALRHAAARHRRDLLPNHDVYITDWIDARDVPLAFGEFDLDDYTDYLIAMIEHLSHDGERIAVMAVCQPGIPAMAAAALMAMAGNPRRPASLVLMGSPMDTARNPKQPNDLAQQRSLGWFENNVVVLVPWPNPGFLRRVYPGFLQLSGFLSMNINRHVDAHVDQFRNLVRGDGDGAEQHRAFYDEYLAVMDLTAEFYLQTIDRVFQRRLLANGAYRYRGMPVETAAIDDIALMTIEGEKDDITGLGQTEAAHDMVPNLPDGAAPPLRRRGRRALRRLQRLALAHA